MPHVLGLLCIGVFHVFPNHKMVCNSAVVEDIFQCIDVRADEREKTIKKKNFTSKGQS